MRKSVGVADGTEGLAEVAGERVGGGKGLPSGLVLNGAVRETLLVRVETGDLRRCPFAAGRCS